MNTNFQQWYDCAGKKYHNIWKIYHQHREDLIQGYKHIEYIIDQELIDSIKNFKKPKTDQNYIQSLMIKQLRSIRKKYNTVRLLYSGGTDSFTILKLAVENDIYIDETITHLVSLQNNPRTNIEYLNGIKYAQSHSPSKIGKVTLIHPTISDLDYYHNKDWYMDESIVRGGPIWLRGQYICRYMPKPKDQNTVTLTGQEKPQLLYENNQLYWCVLDDPLSEYMNIDSIYHFFCDKNNPELLVSQVYALLENVQSFNEGYNNIDSFGKQKRIELLDKLGYCSTGKPYIDKALIGKDRFYRSLKNKRFIKELVSLGHQQLLDTIILRHHELHQNYKDVRYGIEYTNGFVRPVPRFSKKIAILQDSFAG